ncbi:Periplasmic pH-dependent serine endoprotease DegQ precursor [Thalassoglobus polymorphus]|uniref:Periplasmic pH-dependent serine endoprotease DegQ n=2 Tax=Thalassoglobus polymorphus TaxID=2527994 RepID=A0A517QL41_9PLAN|nr:Periplasmic pH-dependent serine endoprotease DegQ precursor [Thalassoglobus polymorphus]
MNHMRTSRRGLKSTIVIALCCLFGVYSLRTVDIRAAQRIGPSNSFGKTTTTANFAPGELSDILHQAGRQISKVAAKTSPAVVHIESEREDRNSVTEETGSGVLLTDPRVEGVFVVTNRHVVADAELRNINILLSDQRVINPIEKIEDAESDIAVLRVRDPGIAAAHWGDSDNLDIGHFVLAMGSPFGLNQSVTLGIISAKGRRSLDLPGSRVINQDFLQTDAAINPGNSGGPLIDLNGRVVGINTAIASQGGGNEGIGFSIPSNLVQFVAIQLLEHGKVRRGYLGVELDDKFDLDDAKRFSLDRLFGARVSVVLDKTPAAYAGLQRDDIIISFDGVDIQDENDLIHRVSMTPVNKQVRMIVVRNGRKMTLSVTLAERNVQRSSLPEVQQPVPGPTLYQNTGLSTHRLTPQLAKQIGFKQSQQGVIVMKVAESNQDADNLQLFDVIEAVGRTSVTTEEEFLEQLSQIENGPALLKVRRITDGKMTSRLVILELP